MSGVGLYLERRDDDVIFPSREGGGGVARAIRRYVTQDESAQRVTDRELADAERSRHPHLFCYGCHYSTDADGFCGPCFRSSETGQALREPAVHSYGTKCRLSTPAKREAWAVALGVLRVHATLEVHHWAHIEVPRGIEAPGGVQRSAAELTQLRKRIVFLYKMQMMQRRHVLDSIRQNGEGDAWKGHRIQTAVRGKNCVHPQCFERSSFFGLCKNAINRCPFAFCGQVIRGIDYLVLDGLFNQALIDNPSVNELEFFDGSFIAAQSEAAHREVVDLGDDAPDVEDCQPQETEVDIPLGIAPEVLYSLHAALKSIDGKFAYLRDVRASFNYLYHRALQKFSTMQESELLPVPLSVAEDLHARTTKLFRQAVKLLEKCHDSNNPERPRAGASKQ